MKTFIALIALCLGCAALPLHAASKKDQARPSRLQVTVSVPPSINSLRDDDIADAFAYRVATVLHEQGFKGHIQYVDSYDSPKSEVPVLEINLIEWRVDRTGNVDCTFSANLRGPAGQKNLGLFSGTSMMLWPRHDIFARADGFEQAARGALGDLAKKIAETKLVPEVPAKD